MHLKPAHTAASAAALGGILVLGLGSAQAAKASPEDYVGCSAGALGSAISGGGTLHLAPNCTYRLPGTLTVSTGITIYGDGATLEGGAPRSSHFSIMTVDSAVDVTLYGVNFTEGLTYYNGGAIDSDGDLTVNGGTFSHNTSGIHGGAIDAEAGSLVINNAIFIHNDSYHGGAVHTDGDEIADITGAHFSQNEAVAGGAIYNFNGVDVADSTFVGNTAEDGGAIFNYQGSLTLGDVRGMPGSGNSFTGNIADDGGAIYDYGDANLDDSTIVSNAAHQLGGGIYYYCGSITLDGSAVYNNVTGNIYHGGC
jgi:hypothetical protein